MLLKRHGWSIDVVCDGSGVTPAVALAVPEWLKSGPVPGARGRGQQAA